MPIPRFGKGGSVMKIVKERSLGSAGFTLIEMLIVILLLGILAAIIVPQVSVSTDDAKLSSLKTDLSQIRGAIEVYYAQHANTWPGVKDINGGDPADADAAATAFLQQLTRYTAADGTVSNSKDDTHRYGPYLKGNLPPNPFNKKSDVTCDIATTDITAKDSTGADAGWKFYTQTGVFMSADGDHDTL
jgi:prepilin-type N-terminal cleavage/methylation domain-containing protein